MDEQKESIPAGPLPENRGTAAAERQMVRKKPRPRGTGCIFRPKGSRFLYISYYVSPGRQATESARTNVKAVAQSLLQSRLDALRRGEREPQRAAKVLLSELFNDLVTDYRTSHHATLRDVESRIRLHLGPYFGVTAEKDETGKAQRFTGGVRALSVTNVDAQAYILKRRGEDSMGGRRKGTTDATIANELSLLRRAVNLAVQNGKLTHAPYISLPKNFDVARTGFIGLAEYRNLLRQVPEHLKLILALGFFTGMRKGEMLALRWEQVNFSRAIIELAAEDTKTRTARQVPIPAEPLQLMQLQKQACDSAFSGFPFVFFRTPRANERAGSPPLLPLGDFEKAWQSACVAAGLGEMVGAEGKQKYKGLLFHDLRRSAVRRLLLSGTPQHVVMKISGHKTESILRRYAIVSEADLTAAAKRLADYEADSPASTQSVEPLQQVELVN